MKRCAEVYYAQLIIPVADLRTEPSDEPKITNGHDRRRDSQILTGRPVQVLQEQAGWCHVSLLDQMTGHYIGSVHPYQGWVRKEFLEPIEQVPISTPLSTPLSDSERNTIVSYARTFLGQPYVWGGVSFHDPSYTPCTTGVDCSGLTYRAYEQVHRCLPRDAKDQWKVSQPVYPLKPADLLFKAPEGRPVNHVMLWTGQTIIEASDDDRRVVRELSFEEKFGIPLPDAPETLIPEKGVTVSLRRFP